MARLSHYGFYVLVVLVVLMVATGFGIAIPADLPAIVFAGSGDSLPANFGAFPFFLVHFALGAMLVVLVAIHVFMAFWHQVVMKDRLMSRMGYGSRPAEDGTAAGVSSSVRSPRTPSC